ncbi:MAG: DUF397 domain-containing protein [Actinomycetota bacterium]|nr:DUF397 domain-containing protein [Actinomycetota bacterium]
MTHTGQVLGPDDRAGIAWRISSYSTNGGGNCVEAGALPGGTGRVAVRHSHHPGGTAFVVDRSAWAAFVGAVRNDEFDVDATAG